MLYLVFFLPFTIFISTKPIHFLFFTSPTRRIRDALSRNPPFGIEETEAQPDVESSVRFHCSSVGCVAPGLSSHLH